MVGPDLRFDVRFGKEAGVLSLSATADFRFEALVDDGAGAEGAEGADGGFVNSGFTFFSAGSGAEASATGVETGAVLVEREPMAFAFFNCFEDGVMLREVEPDRRNAREGPLSSPLVLNPVLLADGAGRSSSVASCKSCVTSPFSPS